MAIQIDLRFGHMKPKYGDDADYDTRVKLPEWQLAALKKRKREQKKIK